MNTKRIFFWLSFAVILVLIVWGLVVAMNKGTSNALAPAPLNAGDHILGPSDAKVTLIEYSDFECPACEAYYYVVKKLVDESSTTMKFSYRHFPLSQHANAIPAAMASEAASEQGKFFEMYDLLFSDHTSWTELGNPDKVFKGYAEKIGLNMDKFNRDYASSTLKDKIQKSADEAIHIGVNATPTFFLNGKVIINPTSYEQFKALIDEAAKAGK